MEPRADNGRRFRGGALRRAVMFRGLSLSCPVFRDAQASAPDRIGLGVALIRFESRSGVTHSSYYTLVPKARAGTHCGGRHCFRGMSLSCPVFRDAQASAPGRIERGVALIRLESRSGVPQFVIYNGSQGSCGDALRRAALFPR